jgi:hypothetical protein
MRIRALFCIVAASAPLLSGCDPTRPFRVIDDPRPIRRVVVAPDTVRAAVGDTVRFTARVLAAGDRDATEYTVVWSVGNPGVASAVSGGRVVALGSGVSEVLATAAGVRGSAVLVVR